MQAQASRHAHGAVLPFPNLALRKAQESSLSMAFCNTLSDCRPKLACRFEFSNRRHAKAVPDADWGHLQCQNSQKLLLVLQMLMK